MYLEGKGTYENFEEGFRYLKIATDREEATNWMVEYYKDACKVEKIFQENKEAIVSIDTDFYENMEKKTGSIYKNI